MVPALAQVDTQVEVERTARAQEDRRPRGGEARSVGGDQHIGGEALLVGGAQFAQPRRAGFLAGFIEHLQVEPEAAARLQNRRHCGKVDAVLALVVGAATAVEPVAFAGEDPRV